MDLDNFPLPFSLPLLDKKECAEERRVGLKREEALESMTMASYSLRISSGPTEVCLFVRLREDLGWRKRERRTLLG